jgi:hypothetical protein
VSGRSQRLEGPRKPLRLSALRSPRKEGEQREGLSQSPGASTPRQRDAMTAIVHNRETTWRSAAGRIFPIGLTDDNALRPPS